MDFSTNGQDADAPTGPLVAVGATVSFEYQVSSAISLSSVELQDNNGTANDASDDFTPTFSGGDTDNDGVLDADETWIYTAERTVAAGQFDNTATARGVNSLGQPAVDTDLSHHFGVDTPRIDIEKSTNGVDADDAALAPQLPVGSTANFRYLVRNEGNASLSNIVVADDNGTPNDPADDLTLSLEEGDSNNNNQLDLGEVWVYSAQHSVVAGAFASLATATGVNPLGRTGQDSDSAHVFGIAASISGVKWNDLDGDGSQDLEEPGLENWTIYVDLNQNRTFDENVEPWALTNADGSYTITGLAPGRYLVGEVLTPNWEQTWPGARHAVSAAVIADQVGPSRGLTSHVAVADLSGDDMPEILLVIDSSNQVVILKWDGTDYVPSETIDVGFRPSSPLLADMDFDLDLDLILPIPGSNGDLDASVRIYENTLSGFSHRADVIEGNSPIAAAAHDFDQDGLEDLAVANLGNDVVSILTNQGGFGFQRVTDFSVGDNPVGVIAADVDGQLPDDLLIPNFGSNSISVIINPGSNTSRQTLLESASLNGPSAIAVMNIDTDEQIDAIAVANSFSDSLTIFRAGNGGFQFSRDLSLPTRSRPQSLRAVDVNNDAFEDLVVANSKAGSISVFLNDGDGGFAPRLDFVAGAYFDVNGDTTISPLDVLLVVNHLNRASSTSASYRADPPSSSLDLLPGNQPIAVDRSEFTGPSDDSNAEYGQLTVDEIFTAPELDRLFASLAEDFEFEREDDNS